MKLTIFNVEIIFLYLSQGFHAPAVMELLDAWITATMPTVIMGDMNWHWCEDSSNPLKRYIQSKGLQQLVKNSTHDQGNCLDHMYSNDALMQLKPAVETHSTYYSDHDILTMYLPSVICE